MSIYKNYKYTSSSSPLLVKHFEDLACYINSLGSQLKILEIGSNDGTLLKMLANSNHFCLGVDPSDVALNASSSMDYLLINDFMSSELSKSIVDKYGKFDVIVSCNSFAHNDEIFDIATSVVCLTIMVCLLSKFKTLIDFLQIISLIRYIESMSATFHVQHSHIFSH